MSSYTIGADISKDHIDLYRLPNGERLRIVNDKSGFKALIKWLSAGPVERVVFEPTGPYHKAFEAFLAGKELPYSKVNPRHARHLAEIVGKHAKTDQRNTVLVIGTGEDRNRSMEGGLQSQQTAFFAGQHHTQ